jgi:ATP-binding cassette subfamily B (MDR/TAP) protein 7
VAELGTHEKLIDRGGLYSELWSAQETLFVDAGERGKGIEVGDEQVRKE